MTDPRVLLVAVSAVDAVLIVALCWVVGRLRGERRAAHTEQREALERLRADLAGLVLEAEARTRELDGQLEAREARLRSLLGELNGAESRAGDPRRARPGTGEAARRAALAARVDEDPAEARLRRDLRRVLAARGA
jgi:hypothetical protein